MEKLYTIKELAKELKINDQTLLRFCREKKIKSITVGREYRIKESAVEEYLSYQQK